MPIKNTEIKTMPKHDESGGGIAEALLIARRASGLTMEAAAGKLGVSKSHLGNAERDESA